MQLSTSSAAAPLVSAARRFPHRLIGYPQFYPDFRLRCFAAFSLAMPFFRGRSSATHPTSSRMVKGFDRHGNPSSSLSYSPRHADMTSTGKSGLTRRRCRASSVPEMPGMTISVMSRAIDESCSGNKITASSADSATRVL